MLEWSLPLLVMSLLLNEANEAISKRRLHTSGVGGDGGYYRHSCLDSLSHFGA
jgi:hypothetical protein